MISVVWTRKLQHIKYKKKVLFALLFHVPFAIVSCLLVCGDTLLEQIPLIPKTKKCIQQHERIVLIDSFASLNTDHILDHL